jgi:ParB-like chromosome segregation protein Spo0J
LSHEVSKINESTNKENMKIQNMALSKLKPYPGNPRKIPQEAVDAVARSIREFGFRVPIVVDASNVIIAGHTRVQAAKQLGMKTVPVHVANDLKPEQVQALRLADNKTASFTQWDAAALDKELANLQAVSAELCEAAGFPLEIEAVVQAIREETPFDDAETQATRREERAQKLATTVEKVQAAVANRKDVQAVIIPLDGGTGAIILADPAFKDFIAEVKRAIDAGENSPLAAVLKEHRPL